MLEHLTTIQDRITSETLPARFEAQAHRTPDATAVVFDDESVSYAELNRRANRLARVLLARGVGVEDVVAIAIPRSIELVVGLFAILKTGACYLPLDPDYSEERTAFMIADAHPVLILRAADVAAGDGSDLPDWDLGEDELTAPTFPAQAAYLIYTSGTTNRSKGVVVSHGAICNRLRWMQATYQLHAEDRVLQKSPSSFDPSVCEFFWPLAEGAALVLARPGGHKDPSYLSRLVRDQQVTTVHFVASMLGLFVTEYARGGSNGPLRRIFSGGEGLSMRTVEQYLDTLDVPLYNQYGPTEAAVDVTYWRCRKVPDADLAPLGQPIWNTRIHLLDELLRPVADGQIGELYIAGAQLARGYANRVGLTAERFVANPLDEAGSRMYRTGDLARRRANGDLEFAGRVDDEVKIRGFRVELAEIETVVLGHPLVRQAAVVARPGPNGETQLVGYAVLQGDQPPTPAELRAHVAALLPEHLVPAVFVVLGELPLTVNGKLDRGALPVGVVELVGGRAPRGVRQEVLCGVFGELLGVEGVSVDDDFFVLGGHSLLAARLVSRVRSVLGVELELGRVFEFPTVAGLDSVLDESVGVARAALVAGVRPERLPLSFAQQRLWFLDQLDSTGAAYNVPIALRITGELDVAAAELALADVLARHEALRTIFPTANGQPYQLILPVEQARVELPVITCADEDELARSLSEAAAVPFDLGGGLLVRGGVFVVGGGCVLLVVVHHVACDGWSVGPLLGDLSVAYAARCAGVAPGWAPLPVQYADYGLWQAGLLGDAADPGSVAARELGFWRAALAGAPAEIGLPLDHPRPVQPTGRGAVVRAGIDAETGGVLNRLARAAQVTPFMLLQAGFVALLSRIGPGSDIVVGTPVAGRDEQALDDLVGFFVNTVVLRTDTSGDPSFAQLLTRVRATALAAYAHQQIPFERVVEELNPDRSTSRHPLFQVMFVLQNNTPTGLTLPGLDSRQVPVGRQTAKFDLTLSITEHPDGLDCALEYASDLFEHHTAELILTRYLQILGHLSATGLDATLSALPILTPAEHHQLNPGQRPSPVEVCLHERFQHHAASSPHATALIYQDHHLTYTELNTRANQLAHWLASTHHLGRGDIIGICQPRSHHQVISTLAVLKTGASYLQLDPEHPPARLAQLLRQAHASAVLTTTDTHQLLPTDPHCPALNTTTTDLDQQPTHNPETTTTAEDPACLMFTSGSTGTPKGVLTPHRALSSTLLGQHFIDFAAHHRWLQCSPVSWDAHALELFGPLLHGATCILQPGQIPDPTQIAALINTHHISTVHLSASLLNHLIDDYPDIFAPVTQLMTGGEAASVPHHRTLLQHYPQLRLINGYSPLENTIFALTHHVQPADTQHHSIPLGSPLPTKHSLILDDNLQPTPPGTPGQLYMTGPGLAHGYLHQPTLTASHFTANPYGPPGSRLYRTGDLARHTHNGTIHYLGRTDHQTKIRGFRIEPNETKTTLTNHPHVQQAEVLITTHNNQPQLTAYVVTTTTPDQLHHHTTQHLPPHLRPTTIIPIPHIPLTPNGKLDHTQLPTPTQPNQPTTHQPPTTPHHHLLNTLFTELLHHPHTNIHDNFFTHGGHSILAMRLISRIRTTLGVELSIKSVFDNPTVAGLADCIAQAAPARPALKRRATDLETE
jgi:amino acid adenylation domain-containing protein